MRRPSPGGLRYTVRDNTEALALLLDRGADVNAQAAKKISVLHFAAFNGRMAATTLLVAKGADLHAKDEDGYTPLDDAKYRGREGCACVRDTSDRQWEAVAAFLERLLTLEAAERVAFAERAWELSAAATLHDFAAKGDVAQLARLLDYGCSVNAKDYDGTAALHTAAEHGHAAAVALLLDSGADLQATNNYLDTPLHFAAREGHLAATTLLVERGADTGARTKFDVSPLEWAKRSRENEWQAVVAVLEGAVGGAAGAAGGGGDEGSDGEAYGEL